MQNAEPSFANGLRRGGSSVQSAERRTLYLMGVIAAAVIALLILAGCSSAPVQKPTQTVAPDSTTASTLKGVQAQVLSLAQQNTAIINAIQKSAQDNDQFRDQVKGDIASLTQVQFRLESWLAEASGRWRLRMLGCPPYRPAGQAGPELVVGPDRVRNPSGPDARSAGAGADAKVPVLTRSTGSGQKKWRPTMLELTIAFLLGALLSSVVLGILAALHQVLAEHILVKIGAIIQWLWNKLVGLISLFKPKAQPAPAAPAPPPATPPPATPPAKA